MRTKIMLLDDKGRVICQARISYDDSFEESGEIYFETEKLPRAFQKAESVHFCVLKSYMDIYQAEIIDISGNCIEVEYIRNTQKFESRDVKIELDIPTTIFFKHTERTFAYDVHLLDISSGGICISSNKELNMQREYDIIINLLKDPLILKFKILRKLDAEKGKYFYGCRFQNMIDEEEQLLRQMVYKMMAVWKRHNKGGFFCEITV